MEWPATVRLDLQRYSQSHRPHSSQSFHDLTGAIPSFHRSIPEATNGEQSFLPVAFLGTAGN